LATAKLSERIETRVHVFVNELICKQRNSQKIAYTCQ